MNSLPSLLLVPLFLCPLASGCAPAIGEPTMAGSVKIPGGVTDPAGKIGYLSMPKGGIVAVNLRNGKVLWQSDEAQRPIAATDKRLIALAVEKEPSNILRVLILDTEARGKRVLQSDTFALPDWASLTTAGSRGKAGQTFAARGRLEASTAIVQWTVSFSPGGPPPPPGVTPAHQTASGEERVDLETGKIERKRDAKWETPPESDFVEVAKLPKEVQETAVRNMWLKGIVVGPRVYGQRVETVHAVAVIRLQVVDRKTGKILWERQCEELPPPPP